MQIIDLASIQAVFDRGEAIERMREALVAQARGECETALPMHLEIAPEGAEVHVKSSYRRGGDYFAVKIASGHPGNLARGLPVGNGLMLLVSAATGKPVALLADEGFLTDARTAAVAALVTRELGRRDRKMGLLGSGIQARLQAEMHAEILDLEEVWVWGRTPDRVASCCRDLAAILPAAKIVAADSPAEVARECRLIVTATAARGPLLRAEETRPGTHIAAVGSDSVGKQELDPGILDQATLLLVDSLAQCERLGELQHAPHLRSRAVEAGSFCDLGVDFDRQGVTVCDFTGLGVEDLFVAQHVFERLQADAEPKEEGA